FDLSPFLGSGEHGIHNRRVPSRQHLTRFVAQDRVDLLIRRLGVSFRPEPFRLLDASFSHESPLAGDLAFLSQSGALITAIVDWARGRSIGFSQVASLGDMADAD